MGANIVIKILANAGALWAAVRYIPGFHIAPVELFPFDFLPVAIPAVLQTYAAAGLALAAVNAVLHPILGAIGAALPFVTGAMLMAALDIVLLYAGALYLPQIAIDGLEPLLLSGLLLGIVNSLL